MKLNEYQKVALTFQFLGDEIISNATDPAYITKVLGLVGEAGEVAEKYKKIIRDKNGIISKEDREAIIKELGDVLWYVAVLANYLNTSLEGIAQVNIDKLKNRKINGTQQGSGDNR